MVTLRVASDGADDLGAIAGVINAVRPKDPVSVDDLRWDDAAYPGSVRILAERRPEKTSGATSRAEVVGAATVGRIYMHPPDFPASWATIDVLPAARRAGIGRLLLAAVSDHARAAGKTELFVPASDARPDGIAFLLRHGFREYERAKAVELRLAGLVVPEPEPPVGIELTSLAARPDLVPGVYQVAIETFGDIPGGDEPMTVGDLAEFRARDVDRPSIPADAFIVAVEAGSNRVVGYASLVLGPSGGGMAWHDMTAVARAWRRRGLATALKRATIRWAIEHELAVLRTGNDVDNAPMRAVNARLGYQPGPDILTMRGPLFDAMMGRS